MRSVVRAFAPANVSCIFKIYSDKNPRWAGSYGVGFTVNEGVIVNVQKALTTKIFFNDTSVRLPTVKTVLDILGVGPINVRLQSPLPLGCGFGLSGASALATAYAVDKLFTLHKAKKELAIVAHTAEVENKTGLGDVVNQYYGGFFLKLRPSSYFVVKRLPIRNIPVYCHYFSKISTRTVLSDKSRMKRINEAATRVLAKAQKGKSFTEIVTIAKEFAVASGLLQHRKTIQTIASIEKKGGHASMIMLGNALFSDIFFPGSITLRITDSGARLL